MKIRKEANPYNPEWEVSFEEREGDRMFNRGSKPEGRIGIFGHQLSTE